MQPLGSCPPPVSPSVTPDTQPKTAPDPNVGLQDHGVRAFTFNTHGLHVTSTEIFEIIRDELNRLMPLVRQRILTASQAGFRRNETEKYHSLLKDHEQRRAAYVDTHSPTLMAGLMNYGERAAEVAVQKTGELFDTLHPRPTAPFPPESQCDDQRAVAGARSDHAAKALVDVLVTSGQLLDGDNPVLAIAVQHGDVIYDVQAAARPPSKSMVMSGEQLQKIAADVRSVSGGSSVGSIESRPTAPVRQDDMAAKDDAGTSSSSDA